jgi:hypothetical protein
VFDDSVIAGARIQIDKPGANTLRLIDCSVSDPGPVPVMFIEFSEAGNLTGVVGEKVPVQGGHVFASYLAGANMKGATAVQIVVSPGILFSCEITEQ